MSIKSIEDTTISSSQKYAELISWFKSKNVSVIVALSGGVDSALVAFAARQALGKEKVLAVTANYKTLSAEELDSATKIADEIDVNHMMIQYNELENPNFVKNDNLRCYHCRNELADHLQIIAEEKKYGLVVDGSHVDDLNDYRPGLIALREKGVKSPLVENGLNKSEIRYLAKINNISIYDKPSNSCLASRIPNGSEVTHEKLIRIENCENLIKTNLKVRNIRVRDHGELARIELEKDEFLKVLDTKNIYQVLKAMHEYGFKHITLDLEGYHKKSLRDTRKNLHLELTDHDVKKVKN